MARRAQRIEIRDDEEEPEDALPATGLVATLVNMAGARSFQAGRDYFRSGAVRRWEVEGRTVVGKVSGTDDYEVELVLKADGAGVESYVCDCPYHEEYGAFCKHCVALGLALATSGTAIPSGKAIPKAPRKDAVSDYLNALEKPALIERILAAAREDRELRQKLELEAASAGPREAQAEVLRKAIENSLYVRGYLEYREARAWTRKAENVLDCLKPLLKTEPALVIELSEFALERIEKALEHADDSDGCVSGLLQTIQGIHLKACEAARPDPIALAGRLWAWEKKGEWETFYGAAQTYAKILGEAGLTEYRRFLTEEWERLPALKPGQSEHRSGRFRLTYAMEALARADGDVDAQVAIRSKDLSLPYGFLQIAELLLEAKRGDEALAWAERGWKSFPKPDTRLAEFLIARYRQRQRHDDALQVAWKVFESQPGARHAHAVKTTAKSAERWPEFREKIVAKLRPQAKDKPPPYAFWVSTGASELVQFFLDEGDVEAAWNEAQALSCSDALWLKLAELRAQAKPEEAIAVWQRIAEESLERGTGTYSEQVALLERLSNHLSSQDFADYVVTLRIRFKRKRNFLKELDERGF